MPTPAPSPGSSAPKPTASSSSASTRPDARTAWLLLDNARSLIAQGKYSEAKEALDRCLEVRSAPGRVPRQRANVLMQLGEKERAKDQMEQYLHTPPSERPPDLPTRPLNGFSGGQQQP